MREEPLKNFRCHHQGGLHGQLRLGLALTALQIGQPSAWARWLRGRSVSSKKLFQLRFARCVRAIRHLGAGMACKGRRSRCFLTRVIQRERVGRPKQ
eukprot:1451541-Alexandrium_andersonii.AAC.1